MKRWFLWLLGGAGRVQRVVQRETAARRPRPDGRPTRAPRCACPTGSAPRGSAATGPRTLRRVPGRPGLPGRQVCNAQAECERQVCTPGRRNAEPRTSSDVQRARQRVERDAVCRERGMLRGRCVARVCTPRPWTALRPASGGFATWTAWHTRWPRAIRARLPDGDLRGADVHPQQLHLLRRHDAKDVQHRRSWLDEHACAVPAHASANCASGCAASPAPRMGNSMATGRTAARPRSACRRVAAPAGSRAHRPGLLAGPARCCLLPVTRLRDDQPVVGRAVALDRSVT